jgi:hypothetical protein
MSIVIGMNKPTSKLNIVASKVTLTVKIVADQLF